MSNPYPDHRFRAFLFDMDGTVVNSVAASEKVWGDWGLKQGLDLATLLPTIHGVRTVDTITRLNLPGIDIATEAAAVAQGEIDAIEGVVEIAGAVHFLNSLPKDRWAMVTSASKDLAMTRITAAGLPVPDVLITAEDVKRGKPEPDGFLLAAERLGVAIADCLVFEDAPAGIAAAAASGAHVAIITETHDHPVNYAHPTLPGYGGLRVNSSDGWLKLST